MSKEIHRRERGPIIRIGTIPEHGFLRLPEILNIFPVSKSAWWKGIKDGRFPQGVKLGKRTTGWRVEAIRDLLEKI